jgi:hypothetical protein
MSEAGGQRLKLYKGFIWIGSNPGKPVSVWAKDAKEARVQLEAEHGEGHVFTLHNEEDASRPR